MLTDMLIRPATATDQPTITALVRQAKINPLALHWQRFLVAEEAGRIMGIGQIKRHADGSRELASTAVVPERRRSGVATSLIQQLLPSSTGPLYLTCRRKLEPYYARFGFRRVTERKALPPYFRRLAVLLGFLRGASRILGKEGVDVIVMERPGESE